MRVRDQLKGAAHYTFSSLSLILVCYIPPHLMPVSALKTKQVAENVVSRGSTDRNRILFTAT